MSAAAILVPLLLLLAAGQLARPACASGALHRALREGLHQEFHSDPVEVIGRRPARRTR
jgi:hypothetical protein